MNSGITRRILNFVIGLHRSAVFKECEALDRATERAFDNADQQKQVVAAEQRRLEDMRLRPAHRAAGERSMAQGRRRTHTIPCAPLTITMKGTPTMSIKTLKISYAVESVIQISEDGAAYLLKNYRRIRDGIRARSAAPYGFLNAIDKLPDDADDDLILRTILGEVTSLIITEEVPAFYPPEYTGFRARISKVAYQETPEKLDPPSDAIPLVVHVGDRNVH